MRTLKQALHVYTMSPCDFTRMRAHTRTHTCTKSHIKGRFYLPLQENSSISVAQWNSLKIRCVHGAASHWLLLPPLFFLFFSCLQVIVCFTYLSIYLTLPHPQLPVQVSGLSCSHLHFFCESNVGFFYQLKYKHRVLCMRPSVCVCGV